MTGRLREKQSLSILVIEPELSNYSFIHGLLQEIKGYLPHADWAQDYAEGLKRLESKPYDITLVDYPVPGDVALQFIATAKQLPFDTAIIMLSSGLSLDHDIAALRQGASDYLSKQRLQPAFLERAIRYSLERTRSNAEQKEVERTVMHTEQLKALGQLTSNISSDLGLALKAIGEQLTVIENHAEPGSEIQKSLKIARREHYRASIVVDHIMSCSNSDSSLLPSVNFQQILLETIDVMGRLLPKSIAISNSLTRSAQLSIAGNPNQLKQILINLALNAQEAMPGGGTLQFSCSTVDHLPENAVGNLTPLKDYVHLEVRDSGRGISKENLERVFDPVFSTKAEGRGFGLGLAIVRGAVENHGGAIMIESSIGRGTSVHLYFPLNQANASRPVLSEASPPQRSSAPPKRRAKGVVVVVEEELVNLEICKLYLESAGFDSKGFTSFDLASKWFKEHQTEAVALVIAPDVRSERSVKQALSLLDKVNPIPAAVCAAVRCKEVQKLISAGAQEFFEKPDQYPSLVAWLQESS